MFRYLKAGIPRCVFLGRCQAFLYIPGIFEDIPHLLFQLLEVVVFDDFLPREVKKIAIAGHEYRSPCAQASSNRGGDPDTLCLKLCSSDIVDIGIAGMEISIELFRRRHLVS